MHPEDEAKIRAIVREEINEALAAMLPDTKAIAAEVVRQIRLTEDRTKDAQYLASLPSDQLKRIQQAKMREAMRAIKAAKADTKEGK